MSNGSKNTVFVVKNQQGLYLNKQQEWVDGVENHVLYRTRHRDEAINTVFEVSSRDIYLRAETIICEVDTKNNPVLATAEALTPARAAQIARQLDADMDEETVAQEEPADSAGETTAESGEPVDDTAELPVDASESPAVTDEPADDTGDAEIEPAEHPIQPRLET